MTPPADHRTVLRALVAAGERFGNGDVFIDNMPHMDTARFATVGDNHRIQQRRVFAVEGHPRDSAIASFIARAANARPALAAIAGKVWLEPEVARVLAEAATRTMKRWDEEAAFARALGEDYGGSVEANEQDARVYEQAAAKIRAALAAAEAELRAVEGR